MTTMMDDAVAKCRRRGDFGLRSVPRHDDAVSAMPTFQYRALEPSRRNRQRIALRAERGRGRATHRILGLIPIETPRRGRAKRRSARLALRVSRPARRRRDDLHRRSALLLRRTGARINDALELLAADPTSGGCGRRRRLTARCFPARVSPKRIARGPMYSRPSMPR